MTPFKKITIQLLKTMKFNKLISKGIIITSISSSLLLFSCIKEESFQSKNKNTNSYSYPFDTVPVIRKVNEIEFNEGIVNGLFSDIEIAIDNLEVNNFIGPVEDNILGQCVNVHIDSSKETGRPVIITLTFNCPDRINGQSITHKGKIILLVESNTDSSETCIRSAYNYPHSSYPYDNYCLSSDSLDSIDKSHCTIDEYGFFNPPSIPVSYPITFDGTLIFYRIKANKEFYNNNTILRYEITDSVSYSGYISDKSSIERRTKTIRKAILYFNKTSNRWINDQKKDTISYSGIIYAAISGTNDFWHYSIMTITPLTYTFYPLWPYNRIISAGKIELTGGYYPLMNLPNLQNKLIGEITYNIENNSTKATFTSQDTTFIFYRNQHLFSK